MPRDYLALTLLVVQCAMTVGGLIFLAFQTMAITRMLLQHTEMMLKIH
jgi:hypothetical protein